MTPSRLSFTFPRRYGLCTYYMRPACLGILAGSLKFAQIFALDCPRPTPSLSLFRRRSFSFSILITDATVPRSLAEAPAAGVAWWPATASNFSLSGQCEMGQATPPPNFDGYPDFDLAVHRYPLPRQGKFYWFQGARFRHPMRIVNGGST